MKKIFFTSLLLGYGALYAQEAVKKDTLGEVVITGFQSNDARRTSLNIERYSLKQIDDQAPYNLTDALAKLPGISQMTSSNAISKPVIRGLYGNRILVLFSGMRFDNQQFQDEHGMGLSQIGIDRVEVIKGPASLLYGSDAMGGVINIIEEKPVEQGMKADAGTELFANTMGTLTDAGMAKRKDNRWWRLRVGAESHADYSDGNGTRVLDSRNKGYYFKAGMGFERKRWIMENSYNFSYNQFGFIIDDLAASFTPDDRWSRKMAGPHHNVMLNLFNSQNTFLLKKSLLKLNLGVQSNKRAEDEGGGQISLDMHLLSVLQSMKWEKPLSEKVKFVANQQYTFEENTNLGSRILVPDATYNEGNVSGYFRFTLGKVIVEAGAGAIDKSIQTYTTKTLNPPGSPVAPFTKNNVTGNGMIGAAYNPNKWLTVKSNVATGVRAANLAEMSSNGLHEGVYRYEIGDPNLKPEQNINGDVMLEMNRPQWMFSVSAYYDQFHNYIYLAPSSETYYGFPIYYFRQQDARIYGTEALLDIKPAAWKGMELREGFTLTKGELADSGYLPFIPAAKISSSLRYEKQLKGKISSVFAEPEYVYVFEQNTPAEFETRTASYYLLNFTSGVTIRGRSGNWRIGVAGTNLTNNAYVDHLSRLKFYGLLNQGRNFVVTVRKEFKW